MSSRGLLYYHVPLARQVDVALFNIKLTLKEIFEYGSRQVMCWYSALDEHVGLLSFQTGMVEMEDDKSGHSRQLNWRG